MRKKMRMRKEPSELERQVDRLLGEYVRIEMRGAPFGHTLSLAGRCVAVDQKQVLTPSPGAHVVMIEIISVEDPPPPPPPSETDLQRLREVQSVIRCPLPPGAKPRKQ